MTGRHLRPPAPTRAHLNKSAVARAHLNKSAAARAHLSKSAVARAHLSKNAAARARLSKSKAARARLNRSAAARARLSQEQSRSRSPQQEQSRSRSPQQERSRSRSPQHRRSHSRSPHQERSRSRSPRHEHGRAHTHSQRGRARSRSHRHRRLNFTLARQSVVTNWAPPWQTDRQETRQRGDSRTLSHSPTPDGRGTAAEALVAHTTIRAAGATTRQEGGSDTDCDNGTLNMSLPPPPPAPEDARRRSDVRTQARTYNAKLAQAIIEAQRHLNQAQQKWQGQTTLLRTLNAEYESAETVYNTLCDRYHQGEESVLPEAQILHARLLARHRRLKEGRYEMDLAQQARESCTDELARWQAQQQLFNDSDPANFFDESSQVPLSDAAVERCARRIRADAGMTDNGARGATHGNLNSLDSRAAGGTSSSAALDAPPRASTIHALPRLHAHSNAPLLDSAMSLGGRGAAASLEANLLTTWERSFNSRDQHIDTASGRIAEARTTFESECDIRGVTSADAPPLGDGGTMRRRLLLRCLVTEQKNNMDLPQKIDGVDKIIRLENMDYEQCWLALHSHYGRRTSNIDRKAAIYKMAIGPNEDVRQFAARLKREAIYAGCEKEGIDFLRPIIWENLSIGARNMLTGIETDTKPWAEYVDTLEKVCNEHASRTESHKRGANMQVTAHGGGGGGNNNRTHRRSRTPPRRRARSPPPAPRKISSGKRRASPSRTHSHSRSRSRSRHRDSHRSPPRDKHRRTSPPRVQALRLGPDKDGRWQCLGCNTYWAPTWAALTEHKEVCPQAQAYAKQKRGQGNRRGGGGGGGGSSGNHRQTASYRPRDKDERSRSRDRTRSPERKRRSSRDRSDSRSRKNKSSRHDGRGGGGHRKSETMRIAPPMSANAVTDRGNARDKSSSRLHPQSHDRAVEPSSQNRRRYLNSYALLNAQRQTEAEDDDDGDSGMGDGVTSDVNVTLPADFDTVRIASLSSPVPTPHATQTKAKKKKKQQLSKRHQVKRNEALAAVSSGGAHSTVEHAKPSKAVTVVELCCGIGGVKEGIKAFKKQMGVDMQVILAVDNDTTTCDAYKQLHSDTPVLCDSVESVAVHRKVADLQPDVIWATSPCSDFSPAGARVEGEAAECTVHIAQIIAKAQPKLAMFENVPAMVTSNAWSRAAHKLMRAGYNLHVTKFRGTDASGSCSRERTYVIAYSSGAAALERSERLTAAFNEEFHSSTPQCVATALPAAANAKCFYWDPRQPQRPGILSTRIPLPSPVTRQPGRAPSANYERRDNDAGSTAEALILSEQDVAHLLGFKRELPSAKKMVRKRWVAGLIQPNAVALIMRCLQSVEPLTTGWQREDLPTGQKPSSGEVKIHDRNAPAPEWMVAGNLPQGEAAALLHVMMTTDADIKSAARIAAMRRAEASKRLAKMPADELLLPSSSWHTDDGDGDVEDIRVMSMQQEAVGDEQADTTASNTCPMSANPRRAATPDTQPLRFNRVQPVGRARRHGFVRMQLQISANGSEKEIAVETLVDSGAEADFLSTAIANKLPEGAISPLRKGDIKKIQLADSDTQVPLRGVVHAQVRFGREEMRHTFFVADLDYDAIIGSDFFGRFGSIISYDGDMRLLPTGQGGPEIPMRERDTHSRSGVRAFKLGAARVKNVKKRKKEQQPQPKRLLIRTTTDVILRENCETSIKVVPHGTWQGSKLTTVLLTSEAPEATETVHRLAKQEVTLMETVDQIAVGRVMRMAIKNDSPVPVYIKKGTIVGVMEPVQQLQELRADCEEKLVKALSACALKVLSKAGKDGSELPTWGREEEDADTSHRRKVAEEHNADLGECSDEELFEVLKHDGKLAEALQGLCKDGTTLQQKAEDMLRRNRTAFTKDPKNPPVTSEFQVDVDTGDAAPIADRARRWGEREAKFIMDHIAQVHKRGQIQPANGPWASNPVLVNQNDKIRFCVDYRRVNKVTRRDEHGLGNMDDLMQKVAKSRVFSALDFAAGYHQIPMSKDSMCKTAFRAPDGSLWEYKVAPFGLVCLPSIFTRCMHTVLGDARKEYACVYVDDILIHSGSVEQHIEHLDDVLQRVRKYGMTVSRHKCQLFNTEVKYLGHNIGWYGVRACADKVKAMVDMAPPLKDGKVDKRLVQVALGCFGYYRRYIHRFAEIAQPLQECTNNGCDMRWDKRRQDAYQKLKEAMSKAPVVMHPDFSKPFVLHTDASKVAVAAVLTQYIPVAELERKSLNQGFPWASLGRTKTVNGEKVREIVVGFYSKMNQPGDAKLGATALECLAVVLALNHFRPYIWGRPVTVVTDASALRWLLTLNDNNGKLLRWAMRLQEYDVLVVHRAGKLNGNADGMSRLPQMAEVNGPVMEGHANEDWPDCCEIGPAPPSGVRFDEHSEDDVVRVGSIGAYLCSQPNQPPFRASDVAMTSRLLLDALESVTTREDLEALLNDEEDAPCSDLTKWFDYEDDEGPRRIFRDEPSSLMAITLNRQPASQEPEPLHDGGKSREVAEAMPNAPMLLSRAEVVRHQQRDPFCDKVKAFLAPESQLPEEQEEALYMAMNREWFQVESDGLLVHLAISERRRGHVLTQWVVPMALRPLVLRVTHDDITAQHPSVAATHAKVAEHFYWRGMAEDVRTYVQSCITCQQSKPQHTSKFKQGLMPTQHMWQRLHADHTAIGTTSEEGYEYLFNVVEARSGFAWLFPTKTKSSDEAAKCLLQVVLETGVMPEQLVTDNAKELIGAMVRSVCQAFDVQQVNTSAYHPQSNGIVENLNGRAKRALARCTGPQEQWAKWVPLVQYALRTTPREETGLTPFFCVYGREARFPLDVCARRSEGTQDLHLEVQQMMQNLQLVEAEIGKALGKRARELEKRNEQVKHTLRLEVGDYVWLKRPATPHRASALDEKFSGPWKLVAQNGESGLSFQCQLLGTRIRHTTAHVQNMKPYRQRPEHLRHEGVLVDFPPLPQQEKELQTWKLRLLDRRAHENGSWSYLWQRQDGERAWLPELHMVEKLKVPPWVLDTFHAIYELRHANDMTTPATRITPTRDRGLSKEDALKIFAKGATVVRAVRSDEQTRYIWGTVQDFVKPRWRVRYEDNEWEDLTSSQMREAMVLTEVVRKGTQRAQALQGDTDSSASVEEAPHQEMELATCPKLPADFGSKYVGQVIKHKFDSGWCRGIIRRVHISHADRKEYTATCAFSSFSGRGDEIKTIKLRGTYYRVGGREVPSSSWHLMLWRRVGEESRVAAVRPGLDQERAAKRHRTLERE